MAEKFDCSQKHVASIVKELYQKINLLSGINNQPVPEGLVELAEKFGLKHKSTVSRYVDESCNKINLLFCNNNQPVPEELVEVAEKFDCSQQYVDKIKKDLLQKINLLYVVNNQPVPEELVELAEFKPFLYGIWNVNRNKNIIFSCLVPF